MVKVNLYTFTNLMKKDIANEVHQQFIPGRSGEVRDVIIDTAGASVGIGLYLLISMIMKKSKSNKVKLSSDFKDTRVS